LKVRERLAALFQHGTVQGSLCTIRDANRASREL
jgi:hypothetical protein